MKSVTVKTPSKEYNINFCNSTGEIAPVLSGLLNEKSPNFIITDDTVYSFYKQLIHKFISKFNLKLFIFENGEKSKTLRVVKGIFDFLLESECDRKSTIICFGGGGVGDIGGFTAGTILRGISYIQIPTTLISQADSSIGGKTGINHPKGKNLIGVFHHPESVIINSNFIFTLPIEHYISGMGEIVKSALIADKGLFNYVQRNFDLLSPASSEHNKEMVYRSVLVKRKIVEIDEKEKGLRMLLNLGHTTGHGIEYSIKNKITHGESVILGLYISILISLWKKYMTDAAFKTQSTR